MDSRPSREALAASVHEVLRDAAMSVEAMTFGRTFPAEPPPSTRDLVVFTATCGAVKRRLRLEADSLAALPSEPPSDPLREAVLALPGECHDRSGLGCEADPCIENVSRADVLALLARP